MNQRQPEKKARGLWRLKRVLLPSLMFGFMLGSIAIAWTRSRTSTIVLYNQTGMPTPPILIRSCGQTASFGSIAEESSVQFRIQTRAGGESSIQLEFLTDPPWAWEGGYVESGAGYRVTLRLWPDKQIEAHTQISFWQSLFGTTSSIKE